MILIPTKTPSCVKYLFSKYCWDFYNNEEKKIYLTFDDGPIPKVTPFVLEQLALHQAKATFFCVGANIERYPSIFKDIYTQGHRIGNHTMNHQSAWGVGSKNYRESILACERSIVRHYPTKATSKLFRPPYGQLSPVTSKMIHQLGYTIILWDVLAKDWIQTKPPEKCVENILKTARPGSIIVFHDSLKAWKTLKYALPKILTYFSEEGFTFEAIP